MIDLAAMFDRICSDLQGSEPSRPGNDPEISGRFPDQKILYLSDIKHFSGISGISGSGKGGIGSGPLFPVDPTGEELGVRARARRVYVGDPEIPETPEKLAGTAGCISGSSSSFPEKDKEIRKSDPLRAVSEPSDPAARLAEWRAGLARLHPDFPACAGYRHGDWPLMLAIAAQFLDDHGEWAAKLGWTTAEIFGVHPEAGAVRVDACGALAIGPRPVRWLTYSAITYSNGNTFRRKPGQPIGTPWWNLQF